MVVVAAAAVGFMLSSAGAQGKKPESAFQRQEAANSEAAAAWVAEQVSPDAVVACDSQMCRALVTHGFPSDKVLVLHPTLPLPPSSQLVIVTASVRNLFGDSLSAQWAPAVIAAFGSGAAQISIRVIAPHGAAAYQREFAADLQNRKANGSALVHNPNPINQSASAAGQMAAGQVDVRLLVAITELAVSHPVYIVDFGNIGTGASRTIPLRYADLAEDVPAAHLSSSAYVHAMLELASGLSPQYRPLRTLAVKLPDGTSVLRIEFGAPTPLGLRA